MTSQQSSPKRTSKQPSSKQPAGKQPAKKQQYSIGTLIVTGLLVLAYWWMTGSLPSTEQTATAPLAAATAPATAELAALVTTVEPSATAAEAHPAQAIAVTSEPAEETVVAEDTPVSDSAGTQGMVAEEAATEVVATEQEATETATAAATATVPPPTAVPTATPLPSATATTRPKPTASPTNPPRAGPVGIPAVQYDALPREALETIILIAEGGPFPYDRDGIPFQNREGILPRKPQGYYSEYTVVTPGASTRGARRIIAGENGELYYTDDHYESFSWVVLP